MYPIERGALVAEQPGAVLDAELLTPRERDIVDLVARGCSNQEIAERLGLQPQTVKNRLTAIYDKTGARGRLALAMLVARRRRG